jgi:hypothetical protein
MVVLVHRMQRDPPQRGLNHLSARKSDVEFERVERGETVPQRDIRRGGLLRLQGEHATDCVNDAEWLPLQKELAGERGAIELPCRDPHTTIAGRAIKRGQRSRGSPARAPRLYHKVSSPQALRSRCCKDGAYSFKASAGGL